MHGIVIVEEKQLKILKINAIRMDPYDVSDSPWSVDVAIWTEMKLTDKYTVVRLTL